MVGWNSCRSCLKESDMPNRWRSSNGRAEDNVVDARRSVKGRCRPQRSYHDDSCKVGVSGAELEPGYQEVSESLKVRCRVFLP